MELAYCEIVSRSSAYLRKAKPASVSPDPLLMGLARRPPSAAINLTLQSLQQGIRTRESSDPTDYSVASELVGTYVPMAVRPVLRVSLHASTRAVSSTTSFFPKYHLRSLLLILYLSPSRGFTKL